jgi:hypothetical protein
MPTASLRESYEQILKVAEDLGLVAEIQTKMMKQILPKAHIRRMHRNEAL